MIIPKEERSGEAPKLKGYGYVEFEDRDSLMSALIIPDTVSILYCILQHFLRNFV